MHCCSAHNELQGKRKRRFADLALHRQPRLCKFMGHTDARCNHVLIPARLWVKLRGAQPAGPALDGEGLLGIEDAAALVRAAD